MPPDRTDHKTPVRDPGTQRRSRVGGWPIAVVALILLFLAYELRYTLIPFVFAAVIGAMLFGIIGLLLAVPTSACIVIVLQYYYADTTTPSRSRRAGRRSRSRCGWRASLTPPAPGPDERLLCPSRSASTPSI